MPRAVTLPRVLHVHACVPLPAVCACLSSPLSWFLLLFVFRLLILDEPTVGVDPLLRSRYVRRSLLCPTSDAHDTWHVARVMWVCDVGVRVMRIMWVCDVGVRCGCVMWVCDVGVRCGCACDAYHVACCDVGV